MSKKIPVSGIGDHYKKNYAKFLNAFILIADKKIKQGTPVDTGRMRNSWQVAQGSAQPGEAPEGDYGESIPDPKFVNFSAAQPGHDYSIHNNLPYAEANAGRSSGFPPSWGGQFRSREGQVVTTVKAGWFDLLAKDLANVAPDMWRDMQGGN